MRKSDQNNLINLDQSRKIKNWTNWLKISLENRQKSKPIIKLRPRKESKNKNRKINSTDLILTLLCRAIWMTWMNRPLPGNRIQLFIQWFKRKGRRVVMKRQSPTRSLKSQLLKGLRRKRFWVKRQSLKRKVMLFLALSSHKKARVRYLRNKHKDRKSRRE